jgi:hypothetical protein
MENQTTTRPNHANRGWKPVYPHQVRNGLLDVKAIRREEEGLQKIEELHTAAGHVKAAKAARKAWNLAEKLLDARLALMDAEAESHEMAIRGSETDLCRRYDLHDPSAAQLRMACSGRCQECQAGEVAA